MKDAAAGDTVAAFLRGIETFVIKKPPPFRRKPESSDVCHA
jgi:hypothetical protein